MVSLDVTADGELTGTDGELHGRLLEAFNPLRGNGSFRDAAFIVLLVRRTQALGQASCRSGLRNGDGSVERDNVSATVGERRSSLDAARRARGR